MASSDAWLVEHEACMQLGRDIMEKIMERNKQPKGSTSYAKHSAHIRTALRQYSNDVRQLKDGLIRSSARYTVTQRELERRQRLLDELITKEKRLEQAAKNEDQRGSRTELFSPVAGPSAGSNPFDSPSTENLPDLSVHEIRQQQQHVIREQDRGLEGLSHIVGRQKQMALDIGNEIDTQNEIIDDITDHAGRTDQRLIRETKHIRIIDRKSNVCVMWVVIVLLLVAILVIAVVPYNGKP